MSFYDAVVPAYLQMLNSMTGLLTKAEAHCAAKKIDPGVLLGSRLFPDMLPLSKQIQLVSDFSAKGFDRANAQRLVDFLDSWLADHIGRIDVQLKPYVGLAKP